MYFYVAFWRPARLLVGALRLAISVYKFNVSNLRLGSMPKPGQYYIMISETTKTRAFLKSTVEKWVPLRD
jgi:hypothetical protein